MIVNRSVREGVVAALLLSPLRASIASWHWSFMLIIMVPLVLNHFSKTLSKFYDRGDDCRADMINLLVINPKSKLTLLAINDFIRLIGLMD